MRTCGLLFAGVLVLVTAAVYVRGADLDPTARDQNADLAQALRVRERGELSDGSRSPLLPVLLAPLARRSMDFFVEARLVSVLLAALALLGVYVAVRRAFSPALALVTAALFLVEWRFQARRICPEPLLALFLVAATALLAHVPSSARPSRLAAWAGALLGLAWLAKGSALLALAVALPWLLLAQGRRGWQHAGALLLGFVAGGAPLLGWNLARGDGPFANASSDHVMWEDRWDQDLDKTSTATLGSYLATHSAGEMAGRLGHGLLHQKAVEWPLGFLVLLAAAALVRRIAPPSWNLAPPPARDSPRRAWRTLALLSCLVWLPPMAWYEPITLSRRLLFPIVPILLPAALDVLWGLVPARVRAVLTAERGRRVLARAAPFVAATASIAALVLVVRHGDPWDERHLEGSRLVLSERLARPRYAGAVVLAKPSRTLPPDWLFEGHVRFLALPASVSDAEAEAWITERAGYVLVNPGLREQRPTLFDFERVTGPHGVRHAVLPPWLAHDWDMRTDGVAGVPYQLLRVVPARAPR